MTTTHAHRVAYITAGKAATAAIKRASKTLCELRVALPSLSCISSSDTSGRGVSSKSEGVLQVPGNQSQRYVGCAITGDTAALGARAGTIQ
jgi:hypothetical protein